jgi:hypothetical protein
MPGNILPLDLPPPPETPEEIERVTAMLAVIPPRVGRAEWRDAAWALRATGWNCAKQLAREWSKQGGDKWVEKDFAGVWSAKPPSGRRPIGFGSLEFIARKHGYNPPSGALNGQIIGPGSAALGQLATLADFNRRFFVAPLGGGTFIFDRASENLIAEGMMEAAFKLRFRHIHDRGDGPLASKWLNWPQRANYNRIVFDPSGEAREDEYNSWRGLTIQPEKGDCSLIVHHIYDVLCGGNKLVYTYVIQWLALLVQQPWKKPGVALVMKSREGAGKSMIAEMLLDIFGSHGFTTAIKDAVAGRFNAHLYDKVLIVLEEAFFAGDPTAVATAKTLITGHSISYEAKGKDATIGRNFAHVMFLTNHSWAVPASEDARRFVVLDVSDERIGDHAYFSALFAQIKTGGAAAFLHHLLSIDLTGFNPRKRPETLALADQRRETLLNNDPIKAWWMGALAEGEFPLPEGELEWGDSVDTILLRKSYDHATRRTRHAPQFNEAMKEVRKLVPAGSLTKHRPRGDGNLGRRYVYRLPPIEEARAKFKEVTGVEVFADDASDE